jgi:hypothetical protein
MALLRLAATDPDAAAAGGRWRLATGWTVERAAEALWAAGAPMTYEMVVVGRGWPVAELERWLVHLAESMLCVRPLRGGPRPGRSPTTEGKAPTRGARSRGGAAARGASG